MPKYSKETIRNAKRWFESFKVELAKMGITFDNPVSLLAVRIHDTSMAEFVNADHEDDIDEQLDAISRALLASLPAFIVQGKNDRYSIYDLASHPQVGSPEWFRQYNAMLQPEIGRLEWAQKHMANENTITDDIIVRLYNKAAEGHLCIENGDGLSGDSNMEQCMVRIAPDGTAMVCPEFKVFVDDEKKGGKLYEKYGYTYESFEADAIHITDTNNIYRPYFTNYFDAASAALIVSQGKNSKIPGREDQAQADKDDYEGLVRLNSIRNMTSMYADVARKNPSWFKNKKNFEIISHLDKICRTPDEELTEEDRKFLHKYPVLEGLYRVIEESIFKAAGVKDSLELMNSDIITDVDGNRIQAANEIEYMARLFYMSGTGELYINGNPYRDMGSQLGIGLSIGKTAYDRMAKKICDILTETDLEEEALKKEDPGYDEFKKEVIALSHNIQRGLKPDEIMRAYDFKKLKEDMAAPKKAAEEYIKLHSENAQSIFAERLRAARELLDLAEKAENEVRHPMEKFDKERVLRKQNALHKMLEDKHIDLEFPEDPAEHLFYFDGKDFKPLLPDDYADMSLERFNREIVPKLESGKVYLSERDSIAFRRVTLEENVHTGAFSIKLGRAKEYVDVKDEKESGKGNTPWKTLLLKRIEAIKVGEERVYQARPKVAEKLLAEQQKNVGKPKAVSAKGQFTNILEKLKNARTRFDNSDEYEAIITMVDFANTHDNWESGRGLNVEQRYITQILAIKNAVNKYINHKACDGVKQNSFKKLAAVEELNNMLTKFIGEVEFKPFTYANTQVKREDYQFSFDEELAKSNFKEIRGDQYNAPVMVSKELMQDQKTAINDRYPNANVKQMLNVDGCMCRIILSAMNHGKVSEKSINNLLKMRSEFLNNPAEKIAPDVGANAAEKGNAENSGPAAHQDL